MYPPGVPGASLRKASRGAEEASRGAEEASRGAEEASRGAEEAAREAGGAPARGHALGPPGVVFYLISLQMFEVL